MKTVCWLTGLFLLYSCTSHAQHVQERLQKAMSEFTSYPLMRHAMVGCKVVNSVTGETVFELNAETGLAPASCQKVITSATAMELLGPGYRYPTELGIDGNVVNDTLNGTLYISGSGDPTLGSWRYDSTRNDAQLREWIGVLNHAGIHAINGSLVGITANWDSQVIPGGWIWEDMGNYYGAGNSALNWHENQYDLVLRSGADTGSRVGIVETRPALAGITLQSDVRAAEKGTGDNAYIYLPPFAHTGVVKGTIPVNESGFVISGSFPDPAWQMLSAFERKLDSAHMKPLGIAVSDASPTPTFRSLGVTWSPALDSINYWFMKKSINLYGEVLLRTIGRNFGTVGSTEKGIELVKRFWREKGVDPAAIHIIDGSGLSPQNRVTADALVRVLQYARDRYWFNYYYDALPVYNGMKLKSGTIGGTKSFAGYHTAKDGTQYTVAMIVNNFEGSASEVVKRMFRVLDELK